MEEVSDEGYGVVRPQMDELYLEEPELIKQGGHFGVRLKASAPSYHIIRNKQKRTPGRPAGRKTAALGIIGRS